MKKQLLLGSILLATISGFSQAGKIKQYPTPKKAVNMAEIMLQKEQSLYRADEKPSVAAQPENNVPPMLARRSSASTPTATVWNYLSGSANALGVLVSNAQSLQWNDELNVVSFIHRKSPFYTPSPVPTTTGAISGVIVGSFTENWGETWDSTAIWNNANYWGRYPSGGLYSAPSNTDVSAAHLIGAGPVTSNSNGWVGSFLASKQIDTVGANINDSIVSGVSGATVFASNTAPYIDGYKFDFARYDFTSTDDGTVRVAAPILKDANGTTYLTQDFRGVRIVKGDYNGAGAFDWTTDSLIPSPRLHPTGYRMAFSTPHMCWDESGTVGYVFIIGCNSNTTIPENTGYQPIVWKTTNSGASWSQITNIDFTQPTFSVVLDHIPSVNTGSIAIPYFNTGEGMDCAVDKHGNLHLVSTVFGSFSSDPDSAAYLPIWSAASSFDGEEYYYGHRPGLRPFIYDFIYTSHKGWTVSLIDSMATEAPGIASADRGYTDNPWSGAGGQNKIDCDARIQLSRTATGGHMVLTFSESDTLFTNGQHKWNQLPNIKARLIKVNPDSSITVHQNEINVTNPPSGADTRIAGRATLHYVSPKCAVLTGTNNQVAIGLPMTISNTQSTPMNHNGPVSHWYSSTLLNFDGASNNNITWPIGPRFKNLIPPPPPPSTVTVNEYDLNSTTKIYPNPASGNALITFNNAGAGNVDVLLINAVGQVIKTVKVSATQGANTVNLSLQDVAAGIYMVNVKSSAGTATKKLVVH
jgi:hypothetical protein